MKKIIYGSLFVTLICSVFVSCKKDPLNLQESDNITSMVEKSITVKEGETVLGKKNLTLSRFQI
jgi:hypothetical protein